MTPLVGVDALAAHPEWRCIDCRHDLTDITAGERAYTTGHVPDAIFMHLDRDLSGPVNGCNGRHPLPDPDWLAQRLGALGIGAETTVVAYDAGPGMYAARLWWLLRWLGHDRVAVLDGGLKAWQAAGLLLSTDLPAFAPTHFAARPDDRMRIDATGVMSEFVSRTPEKRGLLLDARAADRYAGQNEALDPVAGHIPGASNRFFQRNLDPNTLCFRPANELRTEFAKLLGTRELDEVIHYCGSGVTACHNLLAMEYAGLPGSRLYAGSWSEWCADPARPVATGA